jgi:hypothetical protein
MVRPLTKAPMENSDAVQTRGHAGVRQRTPGLAEPTFLEAQLIKGLAFTDAAGSSTNFSLFYLLRGYTQ